MVVEFHELDDGAARLGLRELIEPLVAHQPPEVPMNQLKCLGVQLLSAHEPELVVEVGENYQVDVDHRKETIGVPLLLDV